MKFYTGVFARGNSIFYRGIEDGKRVQFKHWYKPFLFTNVSSGSSSVFKTIHDEPVKKIDFKSISDAKSFVERYKDVDNRKVYGLTDFEYVFLRDLFPQDIQFDPASVRVGYIDIENDGSLDTLKAEKEITAITIKFKNVTYSFGCGDYVPEKESSKYIKCFDEAELLDKFLKFWKKLDLDIIVGFNSDLFDIPYLVNRIINVLGEGEEKRLSPWGMVEKKKTYLNKRELITYDIRGISQLDYLKLYKKFTFKVHESYKLENIAQKELGEGKLDYTGSLFELCRKDFKRFMDYNIKDVNLITMLDDKLGFLELVMALAYDAKCNFADTLHTILPWDIIIHNYLLDKNIVVPQKEYNISARSIEGGAVRDPKIGLSKWVVSLDLESLYPNIIQLYNIGPETLIGKSNAHYRLSSTGLELINPPLEDYCVAANGCLYKKDAQSFMSALMKSKFDIRSAYKKKMASAKRKLEVIKKEIENRK